MFGDKVTILVK